MIYLAFNRKTEMSIRKRTVLFLGVRAQLVSMADNITAICGPNI
jgi:hypothetical protein